MLDGQSIDNRTFYNSPYSYMSSAETVFSETKRGEEDENESKKRAVPKKAEREKSERYYLISL